MAAQVSIDGVRSARDVVYAHLPRTPLIQHPLLVEALGLEIRVKHENHLPTGAFKVRGGVNLMRRLPEDQKARGVATATRGNHGQSIAFAARLHNVRCVIVVPHGNNPEKNAAMRAYGADVIEHGKDFDEALAHCHELASRDDMRFVHAGNEPHLINGVGTYSLEILEDFPEVDTVIYPVGGGSAICGGITVFRALKPDVRIIGVQAATAPSVYNSWRNGTRTPSDSANTFADGLATREPFDLPFAIIKGGVDEMVTVTEEEMCEAVRFLFQTTHNLAEGAAAAPFAAAKKLADDLRDQKVVGVFSGGNIDIETFKDVLAKTE